MRSDTSAWFGLESNPHPPASWPRVAAINEEAARLNSLWAVAVILFLAGMLGLALHCTAWGLSLDDGQRGTDAAGTVTGDKRRHKQ